MLKVTLFLVLLLLLFLIVPLFYQYFFFQAEDGIRDWSVTGVQTCALPISLIAGTMRRESLRRRSLRYVVPLLVSAVVVVVSPSTGIAGKSRATTLSMDPIHAEFSDPDRATTYSAPNVNDTVQGAKITYLWTLTLENVDPTKEVDTDCNNHGVLSGAGSTFVWHHGNEGDPVHNDHCNHDLQGQWGHQG